LNQRQLVDVDISHIQISPLAFTSVMQPPSSGNDTDQEITQVRLYGSHWHYRTDRTVGESFKRCKRVPPGLDKSWAKWAREHQGTWGPPPLALNGISKCRNGTIKIYWADLGDTSDVHAKRRGPNVQIVASPEELQRAIPGLIAEQIEQIQKAPVMQFITDTVGNLGSDTADHFNCWFCFLPAGKGSPVRLSEKRRTDQ
jgi:hypothetical protein